VRSQDAGLWGSRPPAITASIPALHSPAHGRPKDGVASLAYVPEKACPGLDPGWVPVSEKDMRNRKN
jgi:hypothetical protein